MNILTQWKNLTFEVKSGEEKQFQFQFGSGAIFGLVVGMRPEENVMFRILLNCSIH